MTLSGTLSTAVSGLQVNQQGLAIASHNIGNANTEGYSRRIVHNGSVDLGGEGFGGVRVIDIERAANDFLARQVRQEIAGLGRASVKQEYFAQTQDLFGSISSDSSLGQRLAEMTARMETLAIEPESPTGANSLIDSAVSFARDIRDVANQLIDIRQRADIEIAGAVDDLNRDLALVADLNVKIASQRNLNGNVGDLQDQRDQALKRIGEQINIKTFARETGEIVVFTGDSQTLIDSDPVTLVYAPSSNRDLNATFEDITLSDGRSIQTDIRDGRLKGLLDMRDKVLPNLHRQIDALTENVRDVANAAHNRGMSLPPPNNLFGSRAFADSATDQVTIGHDVRFAVASQNGLTTATFELPAGVYTIDDVAAAIDVGLGADATAAVINGRLSITAADAANGVGLVDLNGGADTSISFDDGSGALPFEGFSNFFGLNDFFQTGGFVQGDSRDGISSYLQVRSDLVSDPGLVARGRISTDAAPLVPGTDRAVAIGDGSVIGEVASAFSEDREIASVGGLPSLNKPLHEFAAEIVGLNSQLSKDETERFEFERALVETFETRLNDHRGVNLDEELAQILVLQNAFSASARIITTADEMMQTIVQLKR